MLMFFSVLLCILEYLIKQSVIKNAHKRGKAQTQYSLNIKGKISEKLSSKKRNINISRPVAEWKKPEMKYELGNKCFVQKWSRYL